MSRYRLVFKGPTPLDAERLRALLPAGRWIVEQASRETERQDVLVTAVMARSRDSFFTTVAILEQVDGSGEAVLELGTTTRLFELLQARSGSVAGVVSLFAAGALASLACWPLARALTGSGWMVPAILAAAVLGTLLLLFPVMYLLGLVARLPAKLLPRGWRERSERRVLAALAEAPELASISEVAPG